MRKLIKYLRPYSWGILLIFALLFGQAMADLSLPRFMASIVNVGIQQGGIENAVPEAIRAGEMDRVRLFLDEAEKEKVEAAYIRLESGSLSAEDEARYVKTYPRLADEPIYKLEASDESLLEELDSIFGRSVPAVAAIEQGGLAAAGEGLPALPPGADPFTMLAQLPPDELEATRTLILARTADFPENLLKQYATAYISAEYKAIGMNVTAVQTDYMLGIGLTMLLLTVASAAASVAVGYISARIAAGLGKDLRRRLFVRVEGFSNTEFDKFSTASLITRSTNDITQIQMLMVMLFRFVFYAPILATGGIIRLLGADQSMFWIIAAAVGVMLTLMVVMFVIAIPRFESMQKLVDRLNLVTREILTGLMVIRAFNTQKHQEEKFDEANTVLTKTNLFVTRVMVFLMPAMMLVMNVVMLVIVWVGAQQVNAGTTRVGDMMAFMQYAMLIIMAFLMMSAVFVMLPRASVSAKRVSEVLETEPTIKDPAQPVTFKDEAKGMVQFQDVSFRYPGAEDDVLKHVTFAARPGETTAFIGSTGSGKSTLVNLIPRFYDVTEGRVMVDGADVREVTQHDLRQRIGYVSQKAMLFSGTIESNIRYGNENATPEEIAKHAETAQALDFVSASEGGYAAEVSQGGANLSGGQKQRLSIARALAKRPGIYIFDDSLSALDFKTEAALRKALREETVGATVLIVTQRVSTVMGAEQIVVLDDGAIAGVGTHADLMKECKVYQEIALSQLSKEELS